MHAVFLDFATIGSNELNIESLRSAVSSLTLHDHTSPDALASRIANCECVFTNKTRMTRENIEAAPRLRFIGLIATGVDNIDLIAARDHDVAVCNIRNYCTNSVVEHVYGVLLHLARSIGRYDQSVRAGGWRNARDFCMLSYPLRELSAMTLGIVGYGELGKGVHRVANAFGMRVLVSRRVGVKVETDNDRVSLEDLLAKSDVVSLHCPLTPDTQNLIGARELSLMKPGAFLINTARGGLVDSNALVHALEARSIAGAAIDVLRQEPPVDGDPLLDYTGDNLIITPHIAWATSDARQNAIDELAANVVAFSKGEERNRVV